MDLTNKKVQYDVRDDDVERAEVNQAGGEVSAVGRPEVRPRRAVRRLDHAVVHDFVPIFAGDDPEQHRHARDRRAEVRAPSDLLAMLDGPEQNRSGERVEKHQQEHPEDDEERLADGHGDGQNQHFEC